VTIVAINEYPHTAVHPVAAPATDKRYFGIDVPFMEYIGLVPLSLESGICRTVLPMEAHMANSRAHMHGGAMMSALDFTLSAAARAHDLLNLRSITIDMSTQFYAPVSGAVTVEGRCTRLGRTMAFCDGEVRDADNTLVAVARGVFKLINIETAKP
jgi:uncharacterized protein (TIGR00369 family)